MYRFRERWHEKVAANPRFLTSALSAPLPQEMSGMEILQQLGIRVRFASSKMRSASSEPQPQIGYFPFDVQNKTSSTHIKISPTV